MSISVSHVCPCIVGTQTTYCSCSLSAAAAAQSATVLGATATQDHGSSQLTTKVNSLAGAYSDDNDDAVCPGDGDHGGSVVAGYQQGAGSGHMLASGNTDSICVAQQESMTSCMGSMTAGVMHTNNIGGHSHDGSSSDQDTSRTLTLADMVGLGSPCFVTSQAISSSHALQGTAICDQHFICDSPLSRISQLPCTSASNSMEFDGYCFSQSALPDHATALVTVPQPRVCGTSIFAGEQVLMSAPVDGIEQHKSSSISAPPCSSELGLVKLSQVVAWAAANGHVAAATADVPLFMVVGVDDVIGQHGQTTTAASAAVPANAAGIPAAHNDAAEMSCMELEPSATAAVATAVAESPSALHAATATPATGGDTNKAQLGSSSAAPSDATATPADHAAASSATATAIQAWVATTSGSSMLLPHILAVVENPDGSLGVLEGPPPSLQEVAAAAVVPATAYSDTTDVALQRRLAAADADYAARIAAAVPGPHQQADTGVLQSVTAAGDSRISRSVGPGLRPMLEADAAYAARLATASATPSAHPGDPLPIPATHQLRSSAAGVMTGAADASSGQSIGQIMTSAPSDNDFAERLRQLDAKYKAALDAASKRGC